MIAKAKLKQQRSKALKDAPAPLDLPDLPIAEESEKPQRRPKQLKKGKKPASTPAAVPSQSVGETENGSTPFIHPSRQGPITTTPAPEASTSALPASTKNLGKRKADDSAPIQARRKSAPASERSGGRDSAAAQEEIELARLRREEERQAYSKKSLCTLLTVDPVGTEHNHVHNSQKRSAQSECTDGRLARQDYTADGEVAV